MGEPRKPAPATADRRARQDNPPAIRPRSQGRYAVIALAAAVATPALQEYERMRHPTRLPGQQIADPYLRWMRQRAEAAGVVLVAENKAILSDSFPAGSKRAGEP
jgi:hypothetical protein